MINPPINELLNKVDNAYELCAVVSKRARQLVEGAHPLTEYISKKSVSIASNELYEGKITIVRSKDDFKQK